MFARASFEEAAVPFAAGDILILYSDGVVEASRAEDDEQFGEDRLVEIVRSSASGGLLQAIERVLEELRAWSGPDGFDDDITLVLARRSA
jgi:serine phosphatase RsbU (regulator of sigma subunit)